jgi:hypothetical protein
MVENISGFPSLLTKNKDEEWHRRFVVSIISNSLNSDYDLSYTIKDECAKFFNGDTLGSKEFAFMQTAPDGEALPAVWMNYNKIRVKVMRLVGELSAKGYNLTVKATNKDAASRKMKKKVEMFVNMKLEPFFNQLEEEFGLPVKPEQSVPRDEEELDYWVSNTYKESTELVMEACIKFIARKYKWSDVRIALFRDVLMYGQCFVKNEIVNGYPMFRRVDPRNMVFDIDCTDDFATDASFFGEARYMNIADLVEQYNLSKEEIDKIYNASSVINKSMEMQPFGQETGYLVDFFRNQGSRLFKNRQGNMRVLVYSATWIDFKTVKYKETTDSYGNIHFKPIEEAVEGDNIVSKRIKVWRQGTLIGGLLMKEWGEVKNMIRNTDNPADAICPYTAFLHNWVDYRSVSLVEQLSALQKFKDITMYNVQLQLATAGSKGFAYDVAKCPADWRPETVIRYLKTTGIAFYDSSQDPNPNSGNATGITPVDLSLSDSVRQYLEISMMIDREMDAISGINDARQGIIKSGKQGAAVTNAILDQSQLATETLFAGFSSFTERVFQNQAGLIKISWVDKEKYAPIIGEEAVDFLQNDIDLDLDDYGIYIEDVPEIIENKQMFTQMVTAALSAGQIQFDDAIQLMLSDDLKIGVKKFTQKIEKAKKDAEAMQMQMAQEQMAAQQQMAEAGNASKEGMNADQIAKDQEIQTMKIKADIYKTQGNLLIQKNNTKARLLEAQAKLEQEFGELEDDFEEIQ